MRRALFLTLGFALAALPAQADAQLLDGTPFDQEYLQFAGGSGQGGGYGVQVGPYQGRFMADGAVGPSVPRTTTSNDFALYCVDYYHYASNATGVVNVSSLSGDLSATRLNDFTSYRNSAYLSSLFDSWTTHQATLDAAFAGSFSQANVWGGLHAAIWNTASGPNALGSGQVALARNYFLGLASDNAAGFDTNGWYVLSSVDLPNGTGNYDGTGQEFLVRAEVPEPAALLLMLTGLAMLVGVGRKRIMILDEV